MSKKSLPKKQERRLRPEDFDDIDEFAAQRANIKLESEEESFDEYENFDEEAVLNVPDKDDLSESEDEKIDKKKKKKDRLAVLKSKSETKTKKEKSRVAELAKKQFDSDEDILYDGLHREESEDDELWGKNRKNYYAQDESADAVEEEAQEAKRLQKKKLASLKFDDFVTEDGQLLHRPSKSASIKKKVTFDDLTEFEPEQQQTTTTGTQADLNDEEMADFIGLLKDFKERLQLLRTQLVPLMQRARDGSLPSSSGLSFLQLKYHLMLGYCSSVVYYLMLKGRSGRVEGHPVIKRMIRFRLMLEKIRPLESKMKFQIENLLQAQAADESGFKPNLDDMVVDSDADDGEEDGTDSNVYRAPKLAPVYYPEDDSEISKQKRQDERRQKVLSKSRLLAELRGELDDLPEEESIDPVRMASRITTDTKAQEREAYEEETFSRFQISKKEKRRLEQAAKPLDELDDLDDFFGELEEINETVKGCSKKSRKSESISAYLDQINAERAFEEPEPSHKDTAYRGSDESDIEDDIPKISKKDKKIMKRQEKLSATRTARGPVSYRSVADGDKNAPRPASYNIIKNRGLTPSRSKEQRNPRVRQRNRYEKAVKKQSSARGGRLNADRSTPYSGESTGIRTNLSKSVRFN